MLKRPIIVVDGLNVFIRSFLVNETMNASSEPVGGVVGFLRHLDMLVNKFSPSKVIVVWENGGGSPRRKALYPNYKENRMKMFKSGSSIKDDLRTDTDAKIKQLATLYTLLKHTPVCQVFIKETECDDIIAFLVKNTFKLDDRTKIIVSGDKDFYQLLDDTNVNIFDPARKILINKKYVEENLKITPRNFCLAKTFNGDNSDNIEGVPGVGFKTLVKRFPEFSNDQIDLTLDDIFESSKNILKTNKKLKLLNEILASEDILRRNWKLMYLNSSNLSASQIEKVNGTLEQHELKLDKLGLLKELTKAGISVSFDLDRFTSNLKKFLMF